SCRARRAARGAFHLFSPRWRSSRTWRAARWARDLLSSRCRSPRAGGPTRAPRGAVGSTGVRRRLRGEPVDSLLVRLHPGTSATSGHRSSPHSTARVAATIEPRLTPALEVTSGMAAYLLFRDALGEARNREVYAFALTRREHFTHSRTSPSRLYPDWRKSSVVYEPALREFAAYIQTEIGRRLAHAIRTLGIAPFAVGNVELQLTSHHDGEYYHWHVDNGTRETQARQLTFVYYFRRVPRPFSGGELVIYP